LGEKPKWRVGFDEFGVDIRIGIIKALSFPEARKPESSL
jgi:hypothetical protein